MLEEHIKSKIHKRRCVERSQCGLALSSGNHVNKRQCRDWRECFLHRKGGRDMIKVASFLLYDGFLI
jgi:hypothetical protein